MGMPTTSGTELLIVREVSFSPLVTADVDRSRYVHVGDPASTLGGDERTSYGAVLTQRSQATIALNVKAGDSYLPVVGWQVFLYEVTETTQECVFCGTIDSITTSYWGTEGTRLISLACVSFEQVFGVIRVPARLYSSQTAGFIFNDLLSLAAGWPGTVGTIQDGAIVDSLLIKGEPTLSSIFDQLATLSQFIWGVDPTTLEINFTPPGLTAAPFTLMQTDPVWEGIDYKQDRHDFRDRQYISVPFTLFSESAELFVGNGASTSFTLRNPVDNVLYAFITRNTQNTATGSLSGQPSPGDTVTIGYPSSGSMFNWAPNSPYQVGYTIIDPSNHVQKVTAVSGISPSGAGYGQSGSSEPAWDDTGGITFDSGLTWQDQGILGLGTLVAGSYTFVAVLDNTQFGQVLIGASTAATMQNLVDAINATTDVRGTTYSLGTWENPITNADDPTGTSFVVRNKQPGRGYISSLSSTGSAFSWSATLTSGGITTFNTQSISVGANQPGSRTTSLSFNPGSDVVTLPSPLNVGTNLLVGYYRLDANIIGVENTALVAERAEIEDGTGIYQALTSDDSASNPTQALSDAQAALTAFEVIPATLEFITFRPGLRVGMSLSVGFTFPDGPNLEQG